MFGRCQMQGLFDEGFRVGEFEVVGTYENELR